MAVVEMLGRVMPSGLTINASHLGVGYAADDGSLTGMFNITILNSEVRVTWEAKTYSPDNLFPIFFHATRLAKSLVNLIAFRMGAAATVMLDYHRVDGGNVRAINILDPSVAGLSNLLESDEGLMSVFEMMAEEPHLMLVLDDLIAGLWSQPHKLINCARCVEALRQLVAGYRLTPRQQWPIFNDRLRLTRSYTDPIMRHSLDPRHGKEYAIPDGEVAEVTRRTWVIANRFFRYRLNGNSKLDEQSFPVLAGA
jgi:hypothetical protein